WRRAAGSPAWRGRSPDHLQDHDGHGQQGRTDQHTQGVEAHVTALPGGRQATEQRRAGSGSFESFVEDLAIEYRQAVCYALSRPHDHGVGNRVEPEATTRQGAERRGFEALGRATLVHGVEPVTAAETDGRG